MKIHPRREMTHAAQKVLCDAAMVVAKMDLTVAEELQVLNIVLGDSIGSILKYAIRSERHGNAEDPGDAA